MSSDVSVPSRPALDASALSAAMIRDGGLCRESRVVAETGSTNDEVAAAAAAGAGEGLVVAAETQTAGRGRFERHWVSPARAGLTFSVLLRPGPAVPTQQWSWLPLLAGLAVHRAVVRVAGVDAALKWPNDLLVGPGQAKAAGLLMQLAGDAAVLGVGLNVTTTAAELPDGATSLALEGAGSTDRGELLGAVLDELGDLYAAWRSAGGDPVGSGLHPAYVQVCDTVGRPVRVTLPDGAELEGLAEAVDEAGQLVLRTSAGPQPVSAGDVRHVTAGGAGSGAAES